MYNLTMLNARACAQKIFHKLKSNCNRLFSDFTDGCNVWRDRVLLA